MSWLDRNKVRRPTQPHDQWPRNCVLNAAEVDDLDLADLLLEEDVVYAEGNPSAQRIIYLIVDIDGKIRSRVSVSLDEDTDIWRTFVPRAKSVIVFAHFARRYGERSTGMVRLSAQRWYNLIQSLALPPPALELMHNNNGGSASRFSTCSPGCTDSRKRPCIYHTWLKPSNWANQEHFVYARHDYHVNQNIVLCTSTENDSLAEKITLRLEQYPSSTVFHILYAHLSFCFYSIENGRWLVDDRILQLERRTGQSHFVPNVAAQVTLNELRLTEDIAWARNMLQEFSKAASLLESIHLFTEAQLHRYVEYDSSIDDHDSSMPHGSVSMLSDSLYARVSQIRAQLAQMRGLETRVETQFNMVTALISQRDSQVNISIAASAQADAQLMKSIAVVTMIFLPATFFATFFSMIFFQLNPSGGTASGNTDQSSFSSSKWIWIYFVCTVPLTLLLTWEHGLKDAVTIHWRNWKWKPKSKQAD